MFVPRYYLTLEPAYPMQQQNYSLASTNNLEQAIFMAF